MMRLLARCLVGHAGRDKLAASLLQVRFRSAKAIKAAKERAEAGLPAIDEWAYNHIEKKNGLFKPWHTVEEQISYMNSDVYADTYKGKPIFFWYRRNVPGQYKFQPKPRNYCIDHTGRYNVNHACPICRDEYLFFDYRNPKLIEMFLVKGTDRTLSIKTVGLCVEQYIMLKAQLLKAKEHGTVMFPVEFRQFNYKEWYPAWQSSGENDEMLVDPTVHSRLRTSVKSVHEEPDIVFPTHNRDTFTDWDEWWVRHAKFAKLAR